MQNSSLLVASKPVLNPPQKMMPSTKNSDAMPRKEYFTLGFRKARQQRLKRPGAAAELALGVSSLIFYRSVDVLDLCNSRNAYR
jgi:hypothetical protein